MIEFLSNPELRKRVDHFGYIKKKYRKIGLENVLTSKTSETK